MTGDAHPRDPAPAGDGDQAQDGRRLRSTRSRADIVRAMHALIRDGDMSPSAAAVAEAAGVSMRTVFRHFDEMEALFREMSAIVEAEVKPIMRRPLQGETWRARLDEMLAQRMQVFERIMPHRIAGSLRRFSSPYLMADHKRFIHLERSALHAVLPAEALADAALCRALEMATSFQSWRRLRQDQDLSVEEARAVWIFTVERLLAGL